MDEKDVFGPGAGWYGHFFDQDEWFDQIPLITDAERTQQEASFIEKALGLAPGSQVLDLACGHGRISLELARLGYSVTGVDLSTRSLELARAAAEQENLSIEWVHADMRAVPEMGPFDAVINVFSSFGYLEDERENQQVLDGVARVLAPQGLFLIDTVNLLEQAARHKIGPIWTDWKEDRNGVVHLKEHRYDFLRARSNVRSTFVRPDGNRTELWYSLRLYAPHELAGMLEASGLDVQETWGGFDGAALSLDSPRLILIGRKRYPAGNHAGPDLEGRVP